METVIIYVYYLFMPEVMLEFPAHCRPVLYAQAGLVTCERDWRWEPAPLRDYDLWIVLGGVGRLTLNGNGFALHAGASFVFQPGDAVQGEHDPSNRLRVLYCHFLLQDGRGRLQNHIEGCWPDPCVWLHDLPRIEMLGQLLLEGIRHVEQGAGRAAELALRQLLLQRILDAQTDPSAPVDARIARVLAALQEAPETTWTLAGMAKKAHLSVSQFRRLFYVTTGVTPNAYLVLDRISRARKLLVESDLKLEAIADTLGYSDVYYFNRQFKRYTGTPPAAYRRAGRRPTLA